MRSMASWNSKTGRYVDYADETGGGEEGGKAPALPAVKLLLL